MPLCLSSSGNAEAAALTTALLSLPSPALQRATFILLLLRLHANVADKALFERSLLQRTEHIVSLFPAMAHSHGKPKMPASANLVKVLSCCGPREDADKNKVRCLHVS